MSQQAYDKMYERMSPFGEDDTIAKLFAIWRDAIRRGMAVETSYSLVDEDIYWGISSGKILKIVINMDGLIKIRGCNIPGISLEVEARNPGIYSYPHIVIRQRDEPEHRQHPHLHLDRREICTPAPFDELSVYAPQMVIPSAISAASTVTPSGATGPLAGYHFCRMCNRWGKDEGANLTACCVSRSGFVTAICEECAEAFNRKCPGCGLIRCMDCFGEEFDKCRRCTEQAIDHSRIEIPWQGKPHKVMVVTLPIRIRRPIVSNL